MDFVRTNDNRTHHAGAESGGGRSSAIGRRMSANKFREIANEANRRRADPDESLAETHQDQSLIVSGVTAGNCRDCTTVLGAEIER